MELMSPPPIDLTDATWEDLAPAYEALATEPIAEGAEQRWLATWSTWQERVEEAATRAMIAYTCDTTDPEKEAVNHRWSSEIYPLVVEQNVRLAKRLVALNPTIPGMAIALREFRSDIEIFREENVPIMSQIEDCVSAYQRVTGSLAIEWRGETRTVPQVQGFLKEPDRATREAAFRAIAAVYQGVRDELAPLFTTMRELRQRAALNAGYSDHMHFAFAAKHRFDYTPDDCLRFHDAVEATVVPAIGRLMERRRRVLDVERVRPWDTQVSLLSNQRLRPFDTVEGLVDPAQRMFSTLDPALGKIFGRLRGEGMLDLDSRAGKAPGGYCTALPHSKLPFIFMNAVGLPDDVNTLIHEAGHAFHDMMASQQPFIWQRTTGNEAAELASMGMELLAGPLLAAPIGYYDAADARAAEVEHLEDVLLTLGHIASVDAFQRWVYTSEDGADSEARDNAWINVRDRFERGIDWSGLRDERVSRWYRQLHIFELPFYYIEYGIAQMGALQLWRAAQVDPAATLSRYKRFLSLGGTASLPELYAAAGVTLVFDVDSMQPLVDAVEERLEVLR
jgi:oligoendopeptidase F